MVSFITFVTPTYRRPKGLARCMASVAEQSAVGRVQHLVLPDYAGVGIAGMYASLPTYRDAVRGQYVYLLCDDDELAEIDVIEKVERYAKDYQYPPVILVDVIKGGLQWPSGEAWPPVMGRIDLGCLIVRADVWKAHVTDYGARYEGDFDFAAAIHAAGHSAAYLPLLFAVGAVSRGAAEAA